MEFKGTIVTLKELAECYFDAYIKMFSPTVQKLLHISDQGTERDYLYHCLEQHEQRLQFFFCIFDNHDDQLIGAASIRLPSDSRGQLGGWINEQYWGGGRYQESLKLITQAYFERSGAPHIAINIDVDNMRSYKAHKKFGFLDVGMKNGPYGKQYILILQRPISALK